MPLAEMLLLLCFLALVPAIAADDVYLTGTLSWCPSSSSGCSFANLVPSEWTLEGTYSSRDYYEHVPSGSSEASHYLYNPKSRMRADSD